MKKKLTILLAIAMMATMMTACGGNDSNSEGSDTPSTSAVDNGGEETGAEESETSVAEESESEASEETTAQVLVLPEGVAAEDGDAYLAYGDAQWWMQYGGKDMDNLSFGAEVVHIDGDGTYTVSLDASNPDAVGMNGLDAITGCAFCAVIIQNGEELFPDQATSITIDKITLDGTEVEFTKNYCNYEDGNLRTNIFNSYVAEAPADGVWTADGDLEGISPQIVPASTFDTPFSKIEVTFTISGSGAEGGADANAEDDADANAEDGADANAEDGADANAEDGADANAEDGADDSEAEDNAEAENDAE